MKTCPYCGELVGDSVEECFNCHYNFKQHKVIAPENETETSIDISGKTSADPPHFAEESKYEYAVEAVKDRHDGSANVDGIAATIAKYASSGWRLHTALSSEIGKNAGGVNVGNIGLGINATVDQVILIFERCIYHGKY